MDEDGGERSCDSKRFARFRGAGNLESGNWVSAAESGKLRDPEEAPAVDGVSGEGSGGIGIPGGMPPVGTDPPNFRIAEDPFGDGFERRHARTGLA